MVTGLAQKTEVPVWQNEGSPKGLCALRPGWISRRINSLSARLSSPTEISILLLISNSAAFTHAEKTQSLA